MNPYRNPEPGQVEVQGPPTLDALLFLYDEYRRAVALAEWNTSGGNPRFPGAAGAAVGRALHRKAVRLATQFPEFPRLLEHRK